MFCPYCGRANLASDNFCKYCGKRLTEQPAQDAPATEPTPEPVPESNFFTPPETDFSTEEPEGERKAGPSFFTPPVSPGVPLSSAPSFDLRSILNAPLVLVALIAFSAALGLSLFSFTDITYLLADEEELDFLFSFSTLSSVISMLPNALIVAGSWMTYANVKVGQTKTSGLTLVKVGLIINLVFLCVALGLFELVFIIATAMFSNLDEFASSFELDISEFDAFTTSIMQGVFVFLILIVAAVIVLMVIYYVKACKTVDVIRETIATGVPSDRISGFVAVLQCISGGIIALNTLRVLAYGGGFSVLSSVCSATASICFGVFLFEYRSKMRRLMVDPGRF